MEFRYFSEIRFQLNSSSVDNDEETLLDGPDAMRRPRGGLRAKAGGMGGGSLTSNAEEVRSSVEYRGYYNKRDARFGKDFVEI